MRKIRVLLYWALPPLVLYFIFSRIDVARLIEVATMANPAMVGLGVLFIFPKIVAGALRWHLLARRFECSVLTVPSSIREYWLSLTVGSVVPGSLGSDAYRVALSGRQTGRYLRGAFVLGIEKVAALLSCAALIVALYPYLPFVAIPDFMGPVLDAAHWSLIATLCGLVFAGAVHRTPVARRALAYLGKRIEAMAARVQRVVERPQSSPTRRADVASLRQLLAAFGWRPALVTLAFSFGIHIVAAIQNQIFFQAFGHDLPLVVNLFVSPLMMLLFALPISFGGIGIREGAFIVIYGAFGVPPETALLIAFSGLVSVLLGHAGGVVLLIRQRRRIDFAGIGSDASVRRREP